VFSETLQHIDELLARAGLAGVPRRSLVAALALAVVLACAGLWRFWPRAAAPELPFDATPAVEAVVTPEESAESSVVVHVTGAVMHPGVYSLGCGARVTDALAAAGGAVGDAAPEGVNLARILADGEQVYIPTHEELELSATDGGGGFLGATGQTPAAGGSRSGSSLVNINTATAAELEALPGIGPATAEKIVNDRTENGPFELPEDLMRVPGIGAKKYEALADSVTTR